MVVSTRAVLLQHIKHNDNALLLKLFTRDKGLITAYIRNSSTKTRRSVKWQILDLVDVSLVFKESSEICGIKESSYVPAGNTRYFDPIKLSLSYFLAEILIKIISEKHIPNEELFDFTLQALERIEESTEGTGELPFIFLVELSDLLGIRPKVNAVPHVFNLSEGTIDETAYGLQSISIPEVEELAFYLQTGTFRQRPTKDQRVKMLQLMLDFYKYQMHSFIEIKSLPVLKEVLN